MWLIRNLGNGTDFCYICLVGNHEQENFAGQLADKHGFYFGHGSTAAQSEILYHQVGDGIEASTGGRQHPFQTQLFRRGQFNPACLQSGRFCGNFEQRLIGHERHHEKFLPGPSQYEPHIDIVGNQTPLVYQIEMQFTSQKKYSCHRCCPTFLWPYVRRPWLVSASISPDSSQ